MKQILRILALLVMVPLYGQAQESPGPMTTDRPTVGVASKVVAHKHVIIETGFRYTHSDERGVEQRLTSYPQTLVRLGVLKSAELRISGYDRQDSATSRHGMERQTEGFGPLAVGAKFQLWQQDGIRPQTALQATVVLPTGTGSFKATKTAPRFRLAFTNELTEKLSINYNVGYLWSSTTDQNTAEYTFAVQAKLGQKVQVYIEAFGDKTEGEGFQQSADAGILFQIRDNLQLDVAAAHRLNKFAPDYWVTGGVSIRLPR